MANTVNGKLLLVCLVLKSKGVYVDTRECFLQLTVPEVPSSQCFTKTASPPHFHHAVFLIQSITIMSPTCSNGDVKVISFFCLFFFFGGGGLTVLPDFI